MEDTYVMRYKRLKDEYMNQRLKKENYLKMRTEEQERIEEIHKRIDDKVLGKKLLEDVTEDARNKSKEVLEAICNEIMGMVLNDEQCKATIDIKQKDGVPAADMYLALANGEKTNPALQNGGGVRDLISLSIMLTMREILGNNKAPLFLDEPFKNLSLGYAGKDTETLKKVIDRFGVQTFMVTNERTMTPCVSDKNFFIRRKENVSYLEEIE
ncbi:hypothetical protein MKA27_12985 [[Clostridium] innocuum]|nr:hypothetical protein [[Clostridium] innocuum]MCR0374733.1 hypothetical protein [[Clostridium] innocuum]MCR0559709.1 hypothetical protein [[Clostridium] innocuum]MCR0602597.1 hypothetical protein [[Clostridium] innocuum]